METLVKNEFSFYASLAKPLILNLPKSKDRILAAAWMKKCMDEQSGEEKLRTTYLKLLLFSLQRRKLGGIFSDDPVVYDTLEEVPEDYDLNELARNLIIQENQEREQKQKIEMSGDMPVFPTYTTDCSSDLTEYVAAQDIPNFGVHAFYAISRYPINKWQRAEKAILPKGTRSAIDTTPATSVLSPACVCTPNAKGAVSAPEGEEGVADEDLPECRRKKVEEPDKRKRKPKKMGRRPPSHPIGDVHHRDEPDTLRLPPTWGTNLMEVRDKTDLGNIDEPTEERQKLEAEVTKLLEEQDEEEDDDDDDDNEEDILGAKTADMLHMVDEWKKGKLDTPEGKKMPSRLAKLGDRSGIKVPKSLKGKPKIAVKGMKKGKGKGKGDFGPKPANVPQEFANWTEKDLEEHGLTWADLVPVDENIDDELARIEAEVMGSFQDQGTEIEPINDYADLTDYDALIREAEADLQRHKSTYDLEFEEDEPVVELFEDELAEIEDEVNVSRAVHEVSSASPAMTVGIPVTTPKRSPTIRRTRSPERTYAEEDDVLLKPRASPLRAPKEDPFKKPPEAKKRKTGPPTDKDPHMSELYRGARSAIDPQYAKLLRDQEEAENEIFGDSGCNPCASSLEPRPPGYPPPGASEMPMDAEYDQFESAFEDEDRGYDDDRLCGVCPTSPERPEDYFSAQSYSQFGPEADFGYDEPCGPCNGDPMEMAGQEEFELFDEMYYPQPDPMQMYDPLASPQFDYGPPVAYGAPPPPPGPSQQQLPPQQEQRRPRAVSATMEPPMQLRLGSPQARQIIELAEYELMEDRTRRMRAAQDQVPEEPPPPEDTTTGTFGDSQPIDTAPQGVTWQDDMDQPSCMPCQSGGPEGGISYSAQPPSKLPSRLRPPSKIPGVGGRGPPRSQIPATSQIPSRSQIPRPGQTGIRIPCRGKGIPGPTGRAAAPPAQPMQQRQIPQAISMQRPPSPQRAPSPQRLPSPAQGPPPQMRTPSPQPSPYQEIQETPVSRRYRSPDRIATPTSVADRSSRRLFEGEGEGPCGPCTEGAPEGQRRSPKNITPPPYQPPLAVSAYSTPEGMAGPSQRPTGLTPQGYDSDFESPPRPATPGSPQFPPARRCRKRGRVETTTTPQDDREMPPPSRQAAPRAIRRMEGRRIFEEEGAPPRQPPMDSPLQYSPTSPFVPEEDDWVSPPPAGVGSYALQLLGRGDTRGRDRRGPDICSPCGEDESDFSDSFGSGYEGDLEQILQANVEVPPEQYPPPGPCGTCGQQMERPDFEQRFDFHAIQEPWKRSEKEFEYIGGQAGMFFDTTGGMMDITPPPGMEHNYYPDIEEAADALGRSVQQYSLPESPPPSPFLQSPYTPPGAPQWSPASVPSGSPRTPPPRPAAPTGRPTKAPCRGGPAEKRSKIQMSKPKQLRETRSSQLRKQQMAKKQEEKLSPGSRAMQKRKEKAAKAAEDKKKKAVAAKQKAEEEAKQAASRARVAERAPGRPMRRPDYRRPGGTGAAPTLSAEKDIPTQRPCGGPLVRTKLFGAPTGTIPRPGAGRPGAPPRGPGMKSKGRKGAGPPESVCGVCDGDTSYDYGPDLVQQLQKHEVNFPRRDRMAVVVGGKTKRIMRSSKAAVKQMGGIMEEEGSPCAPCSEGGGEDDYEAALAELGMTADEAAAVFDPGFMDELEEEDMEAPGSPDAIQQMEAHLVEMAAYEKQQTDVWKTMAADLTDDELQELGITREELGGPCGPCDTGAAPTGPPQLSQKQQDMLAQLEAIEQRMDELTGPTALTEFDLIEQSVIQREQEEREYFERILGRGPDGQPRSPGRSPAGSPRGSPVGSPRELSPARSPQRAIARESPDISDEQMEFDRLEREMEEQEQTCPQTCMGPAAQEPQLTRQQLFEQQLQTQGPPIRGRPFPASGITYSPPRPKEMFGPAPYEQKARALPMSAPPPPPSPSPPRTPPRARSPLSPRIPTPPSPPPSPGGILEEEPPYFSDFEDGFPCPPCDSPEPQGPPAPRWSPTPPPPSPPGFIPTPPSPPLIPGDVREHITSMARPEFDPGRRDLQRDTRLAIKKRDTRLAIKQRDTRFAGSAPAGAMYSVQEEEPLIPCLAGDGSFMGQPVVPGERAPRRPRRRPEKLKPTRLFDDSEVSQYCRRLEQRFDLPPMSPEPEEERHLLDEPLPEGLPKAMSAGHGFQISPFQRQPIEPIPLAPWEEGPSLPPAMPEPYFGQEMMPIGELYQGGGPVHPDLADLVGYEPPMEVPEDVGDICGECMGDEMFFTPPRYPEIDERELDREAALAYEPPYVMKNIWLTSPQDIGYATPPSGGKGQRETYTPTATPPLGLLDSPCMDCSDDVAFGAPAEDYQSFMQRTPPLEQVTTLQEMKYRTYHAKGREGIKPKPMYFGGYGEAPQRPIPRWHGRGGARDVIQEGEEPPPTSPGLDEFEQLEWEAELKSKRKGAKKSHKRDKQRESRRQMMIDEMTEEAERRAQECVPCSGEIPPSPPQQPPSPVVEYGPHMPEGGIPWSPPRLTAQEKRDVELYMLEQMDVDVMGQPLATPPRTAGYLDEDYDVLEGYDSPPPLSPQPPRPCWSCGPPTPPSPPPAPPMTALERYWEEKDRPRREKEARDQRRQQLYQSNIEEIGQMFGPSEGPPSPGPDADFYASIYAHQVPTQFRQGGRPGTAIRDQIGSREVIRQIPRRTPGPGLAPIPEPKSKQAPVCPLPPPKRAGKGPAKRTGVPTRGLPPVEADRKASAQRMAEARKHYQKMGRATAAGGQRAPCGPCDGAAPQAAPSAGGQQPGIGPEEAQKRARERLRARKRQEAGPVIPMRAQPPPPAPRGPAPFTGFVPPQVQRMMPAPPAPRAYSADPPRPQSASRGTQLPSARQPGGCCGGRRAPSGQGGGCCGGSERRECAGSRQQGTSTQGDQRPQTAPTSSGEGPRRVVQKTSSTKRIVTKQKR